ncbi:MAG: hypothetical protein LC797_01185 [Chloroflexi bacterium]|nr:hypothetical protein [Chloroflexota bacterium]
MLGLTASPQGALGQVLIEDNEASRLYAALAARLDPATHRAASRLAQVTIDPGGDSTVVFAILDAAENAQATRDGAMRDISEIIHVAFASPEGQPVRSLTVLGTFPFKSTKGFSVRESPVTRAVISVDTAAHLDWQELSQSPARITNAVDQWWMQGAFATAIGPSEDRPENLANTALQSVVAHLDETLRALQEGDVPIARSQFKQFFDAWDETAERVADSYPAQFETLDLELERAELALLHTQPEDIASSATALQTFRATLLAITLPPDGPLQPN